MQLQAQDTKINQMICLFAEQPVNAALWNEEEERFDTDKVDKWKLGMDDGLFIEDIYSSVNGSIPDNVYERAVKLNRFQAQIWYARRWFWEEQALLLVCVRRNGNRSTYYYLSNELSDYLGYATDRADRANYYMEDLRHIKPIVMQKKTRLAKERTAKDRFLKSRIPSRIRIDW